MAKYADRRRAADRDISMTPAHRLDSRVGQREDRIPRYARDRYGFDLNCDLFRGSVHVVGPSPRYDVHAKPRSVSDCCEHMRRTLSAGCYDRVARLEPAKQELEGTDFVSSTDRGIEILALDPAVTIARDSLDGRGKSAQLCPRNLRKRGEPAEQGNPGVGSA